ncbi:hypothetical protein [Chitinophaga sedimenti]|uniref:hypothetical protein n=1 Tax=Chitinophaga sedimenti TaxID=2033606 RepID=UPI00249E514C|nr:hypothetical protein [Chitinophaga sedimenti]
MAHTPVFTDRVVHTADKFFLIDTDYLAKISRVNPFHVGRRHHEIIQGIVTEDAAAFTVVDNATVGVHHFAQHRVGIGQFGILLIDQL